MIQWFTNFGDQAVILPIWAIAACGFLLVGWRRAMVGWLVAVPVVLGLVLIGKLLTLACPAALPDWLGLHSPSGHTASAAVMYGGLIALLVPNRAPQRMALIAATLVAMLIGASRLMLGVHTPADVLIGAPIGIAGAYAMVRYIGPPPPHLRFRPWMCVALLGVLMLLHGQHFELETTIGHFAWQWAMFGACHR